MASITDEEIAQPGAAGTRAAMAFQGGHDTNVTVTGKPRRIEFDPEPPQISKTEPLIPPSLRGRTFEFGSHRTLQDYADLYGLFWVKINRPCIGPSGNLFKDDVVQLPGNYAWQLATSLAANAEGDRVPLATFLLEGSTKAELDLIRRAKEMGLGDIQLPRTKAEDRPEFQHLKKRGKWMSAVLDEPPPPGTK